MIKLSEKAVQSAPKKKLSERKGYIIYKKIRSIVFTLLLITVVVILISTMIARFRGETPSLFGYSVFRVSSGSMEPEYKIGDVIIVKSCGADELKVNDVCTYNGKEGEFAGKIVTHRVIKAQFEENGEKYIQTKGDANPLEDPKIKADQVIGRVETKIGFLRVLYNFFVTPLGLITIIALIIAAFFNEIVNFVKSLLGLGHNEENKDSVEDIIERYQKENAQKQKDEEEN